MINAVTGEVDSGRNQMSGHPTHRELACIYPRECCLRFLRSRRRDQHYAHQDKQSPQDRSKAKRLASKALSSFPRVPSSGSESRHGCRSHTAVI
jgi:hypothetical protein